MNRNRIISEVINRYIVSECGMLKEYRNPNSADTVRTCGDMLEQLHDSLVNDGCSKREVTVVMMAKIIGEIRHLEQMMR